MLKQAVTKFIATQSFLYQMHSACPQIPFPSNAIPVISNCNKPHSLLLCITLGSYERSGGPRTGWGPHSFAKWYSGTPITINELAPVQWTEHTVLLVHLKEHQPMWVWLSSHTTGSSRHSCFLKGEYYSCRYIEKSSWARKRSFA